MVAFNTLAPFYHGQSVRLLACFLLWPAHHASASLPGHYGGAMVPGDARYLSGRHGLTFVGENPDADGGAIVRTDDGRQWCAPMSALAESPL